MIRTLRSAHSLARSPVASTLSLRVPSGSLSTLSGKRFAAPEDGEVSQVELSDGMRGPFWS